MKYKNEMSHFIIIHEIDNEVWTTETFYRYMSPDTGKPNELQKVLANSHEKLLKASLNHYKKIKSTLYKMEFNSHINIALQKICYIGVEKDF